MLKSIMFYDPVAPNPYTLDTLARGALGGTEASCLRIAKGLVERGHHVVLAQRGVIDVQVDKSPLYYYPANDLYFEEENIVSTVITLRDAGVYLKNKAKFPNSKHYLWMHDVVSGEYALHIAAHLGGKVADMICVSNWHKKQILEIAAQMPNPPMLNIRVIYGPLADYCVKTKQEYDPFKLIFFSSPHKGLDHTLEVFKALLARESRYKLYVSNPGYFKSKENLPERVIGLGTLTHWEVIEHVRTSLCLFYPNTTFPETFGLVMAEADAVGTPVIAHRIGAAPEVVYHHDEIMDCYNVPEVVQRVLNYTNGERLIVQGKKEFSLKSVIDEWERLI